MATSVLGFNVPAMTAVRGLSTTIGAVGVWMNTRAVLTPSYYALAFGFPDGSPVAESASSNPFIKVVGGRSVAFNAALLACVYLRYDRAMGVLLATGSLGAFFDGFILRNDINGDPKKAWQHWTLAPVIAAVGVWTILRSER